MLTKHKEHSAKVISILNYMLTVRVKVNLLLLSLYKTCPVNEQMKTTHIQK